MPRSRGSHAFQGSRVPYSSSRQQGRSSSGPSQPPLHLDISVPPRPSPPPQPSPSSHPSPHTSTGSHEVQCSGAFDSHHMPPPPRERKLLEPGQMRTRPVLSVVKEVVMSYWPADVLIRFYSDMPSYVYRRLWELFQMHFYWAPEHEDLVYQEFGPRVSSWLRETLRGYRNGRERRGTQFLRPEWIPSGPWQYLCQFWNSENFKVISKKNRDNKMENEASLRTPWRAGPRSSGDILLRLEHERPDFTMWDLFQECYMCSDKSWSGPQTASVAVKVQELAQTLSGGMKDIDDMLWVETVGMNRDRAFGLGSAARCRGLRKKARGPGCSTSQPSQTQSTPFAESQTELHEALRVIATFLRDRFLDLPNQLRDLASGQSKGSAEQDRDDGEDRMEE